MKLPRSLNIITGYVIHADMEVMIVWIRPMIRSPRLAWIGNSMVADDVLDSRIGADPQLIRNIIRVNAVTRIVCNVQSTHYTDTIRIMVALSGSMFLITNRPITVRRPVRRQPVELVP